jgi:hypothetical protein
MRVFGTPEKPNPPTKTVVSDFMSLIASCAEETILLIAGRDALAEKNRMPVAGPRRRAVKRRERCIVRVVIMSREVSEKIDATGKLRIDQPSLRWRARSLMALFSSRGFGTAQSTPVLGVSMSTNLNAPNSRVRIVVYSEVDAPHTSTTGACITANNRLGQTDANAVPMAGKSKAPQSEVDEGLAGQDAEVVAVKTHVHWVMRHAEKGNVENISKAKPR